MGWWGGGLCDFGVTPVPIGLGFGFGTALGLGLGLRGPDLGLGLDNMLKELQRTFGNFMTKHIYVLK